MFRWLLSRRSGASVLQTWNSHRISYFQDGDRWIRDAECGLRSVSTRMFKYRIESCTILCLPLSNEPISTGTLSSNPGNNEICRDIGLKITRIKIMNSIDLPFINANENRRRYVNSNDLKATMLHLLWIILCNF